MDRRRFLLLSLAGAVFAPLAADAQPPATIARIGYLGYKDQFNAAAFVEGLHDLGYVEGRNVVIEYRDTGGNFERLPALVAELVALKVDVIVAPVTPNALAAKRATKTIPVVFISLDAVSSGLVGSLARPGGNLTGVSALLPDLVGKWLEYLKQAVPGVIRVGVLWEPGAYPDRTEREMRTEADAAGRGLGVRLHFVGARSPADFERAFSELTKASVGSLMVFPSRMLIRARRRIVDLAVKHRLPTMYPVTEFVVEAGGLMVYGPNVPELHRRMAVYVDKILKGARPGNLPVEQPTKFELIINLKTAKALGLTIPPSLLARADHVIE